MYLQRNENIYTYIIIYINMSNYDDLRSKEE